MSTETQTAYACPCQAAKLFTGPGDIVRTNMVPSTTDPETATCLICEGPLSAVA